jgi:hypothetical protein
VSCDRYCCDKSASLPLQPECEPCASPEDYVHPIELVKRGDIGRPSNAWMIARSFHIRQIQWLGAGLIAEEALWPTTAMFRHVRAPNASAGQDSRNSSPVWTHIKARRPAEHAMWRRKAAELAQRHKDMFPHYAYQPAPRGVGNKSKRKVLKVFTVSPKFASAVPSPASSAGVPSPTSSVGVPSPMSCAGAWPSPTYHPVTLSPTSSAGVSSLCSPVDASSPVLCANAPSPAIHTLQDLLFNARGLSLEPRGSVCFGTQPSPHPEADWAHPATDPFAIAASGSDLTSNTSCMDRLDELWSNDGFMSVDTHPPTTFPEPDAVDSSAGAPKQSSGGLGLLWDPDVFFDMLGRKVCGFVPR